MSNSASKTIFQVTLPLSIVFPKNLEIYHDLNTAIEVKTLMRFYQHNSQYPRDECYPWITNKHE